MLRRSPLPWPATRRRVTSASRSSRSRKAPSNRAWSGTLLFLGREQDVLDHPVGCDAFGIRLEVEDDPVAQGRQRDLTDVLKGDIEPPLQDRADLGAQHQRLEATRAGAVAHVPSHGLGSIWLL